MWSMLCSDDGGVGMALTAVLVQCCSFTKICWGSPPWCPEFGIPHPADKGRVSGGVGWTVTLRILEGEGAIRIGASRAAYAGDFGFGRASGLKVWVVPWEWTTPRNRFSDGNVRCRSKAGAKRCQ